MAMHIDMDFVLPLTGILRDVVKVTSGERFHLSRVCVHATVFNAAEVAKSYDLQRDARWASTCSISWREALNRQADFDDEVEDWQVHRNLQRVAAAHTSAFAEACVRDNLPTVGTTTLTASAQFPTVSTLAHGRAALSSFRRHSYKVVCFIHSSNERFFRWVLTTRSTDSYVLPDQLRSAIFDVKPLLPFPPYKYPVVGSRAHQAVAVVQIQFDIVDLCRVVHPPPWRPGKRRRGPLDPILHESPRQLQEHASKRADHAKSTPFNGVRCRDRSRRKIWMAEIRLGQNKVWIGDFESEAQAARAVDAAHFYYGRSDLLNFADAPQLLSARPAPAAPLTDAAEKKLQFVKKEAKWLASRASSRPSSPSAVAVSQVPHSYNQMPDSGANGIHTMHHDMGVAIESPIPEEFHFARETETMDAWNKFQMLEDFLLRSPSPVPEFQKESRLDWHCNVEDLPEQETEEIWRLIEL